MMLNIFSVSGISTVSHLHCIPNSVLDINEEAQDRKLEPAFKELTVAVAKGDQ